MKRIVILIIAITASLLSAINLEQAKKLGLENNFSYQNSENSKKSATANKLQAYSAILPSVTASGSYSGEDLDLGDESYALRLTQPILQGGSIIYGMKMANTLEDIAENNLSNAMFTLIANVENKYYSVLEAKALLDVAAESQQRAQMQYESAETKHLLGAISGSDFLQFKLEKSQSDVSLFSADKQYKIALKDFNNYLNSNNLIPEEIVTEVALQEAEEISEIDISEIELINTKLLNLIMDDNLDLKNAEANKDNAKSNLRLSQTSFLPSIDFSISKNWADNDMTDGLEDSETYSLNFSVPIFPLVDKGLASQTKKYDYKNSENNLAATKDNLQLDTESSWLEFVTYSKSLTTSKISLEQATALYEQSTIEFQMGELSSSDYLASSITLSNAESQFQSAVYNYLRNKSNLNKLLCAEDYSTLNEIIFQGAK